eukprot:TRINITY_DN13198_c0_g1_i1.p1 TRINITY_DN13198_c0_g1~~TRINITY_DN13198_c0_g1_i1.p1  ORF type:complete len:118 (+),score=17.02 TRINITY_DN13198_c0_g1_i1:298-651(+)
MATGFQIVQDLPQAIVSVSFSPSSIGSGLELKPSSCSPELNLDQCAWFEIGTLSGHWYNASATIDEDKVFVEAEIDVEEKVSGVRYGWGNYPVATLFNLENLPALPFAFPNPIPHKQ